MVDNVEVNNEKFIDETDQPFENLGIDEVMHGNIINWWLYSVTAMTRSIMQRVPVYVDVFGLECVTIWNFGTEEKFIEWFFRRRVKLNFKHCTHEKFIG